MTMRISETEFVYGKEADELHRKLEEITGVNWIAFNGDFVRCITCKHYITNFGKDNCDYMDDFPVRPDGFCAWGEKIGRIL